MPNRIELIKICQPSRPPVPWEDLILILGLSIRHTEQLLDVLQSVLIPPFFTDGHFETECDFTREHGCRAGFHHLDLHQPGRILTFPLVLRCFTQCTPFGAEPGL
jgi:hypothetical protein